MSSGLTGPLIARKSTALSGAVTAPGDKSISHRALIFTALAAGESEISGLLEGDDVLRTAAAMRAFGADVERDGELWRVHGRAWVEPEQTVYCGNSGTGVRLLMGAAAGAGIAASFDGDSSLRGRPMGRILEPLRMMGANAQDNGGRLPVTIEKSDQLKAVDAKLAKPSAQVKSAILLAALGADGVTRVHEPDLCRDHTERMMEAFGVHLDFEPDGEHGRFISIKGGQTLNPTNVVVPGDPSSAAFFAVAASITPGSDITIRNVLMNPLRTGVYETLVEMGADISRLNERVENGEPIADLRIRHNSLRGVEVPASRAPSMIDEYPVLAIAAAFAEGETKMLGLEELRVKESDRIASVEIPLRAGGVSVSSGDDWMSVRGNGEAPKGGMQVATNHDHRIAMSFLVMGGASKEPVTIDDSAMIATSFPNFTDLMAQIGASIETD